MTSRYEAEFDHGEFCVDLDLATTDVVAVMCDACKKGVSFIIIVMIYNVFLVQIPCINMCCPHGHAYEKNLNDCKKVEGGLSYNPVLWDHNDKVFLENWRRDEKILIVGPEYSPEDAIEVKYFECPKVPGILNEGPSFQGVGTFKILVNGKLEKEDISRAGEANTTQIDTTRWSSDSFCVIYTKPEYFYHKAENDTFEDWHSDYKFSFMTCHPDKVTLSVCETFSSTFHFICVSISTTFLIATLLVYVCEDSLRRTNPLFSKITIGFISNLIICCVVVLDNRRLSLEEETKGTMSCIISGYLLQYFFLAFFFWINGMSFNIWLKFTQMSMQQPSKEEENKKFWKYFLYAQGSPLLIVILTAIVDAIGKGETHDGNLIHYPNMGKHLCFVGATTSFKQSYFGRPEFLYFHMFNAIIQLSNIIFLGLTIKSLYTGWHNQAKLHKISGKYDIIISNILIFYRIFREQENLFKAKFEKLKEQLAVVLRLFVIMGIRF